MKSKKTKIKIKRSKVNLYNKKKSKTKQVLAIVITAAAACALCILGYGIGKPLIDYFRNRGSVSDGSTAWSPEGSDVAGGSSSGTNGSTDSGSSGGNELPEPEPAKTTYYYYLSDEAALSYASLNAELAAAKSSGHSAVVVNLKNSDGYFLYTTSIEKARSQGTLSAAQIAEEISKAGFMPVAKISTVKDKTNGPYFGCHYKFENGSMWLDNAADRGGKTWLSPFDTKTSDFIRDITAELSVSGFKQIIAAETMYPNFYAVDIKVNLAHLPLSDRTKRAEALWKVLDAAKEGAEQGGAELYVEMNGADLILDKKDGTDAEPAYTKAPLKTANLIVDYTPSDSVENAYSSAQAFIESLKTSLDGAECVVRIKGSSSSTVLENVKKAFNEADIPAFSQ